MDAQNKRSTLYEFLEKNCLVQKGSEFTHTSIYDPTGSYYIAPDKVDRFFKLYKAAVDCDADCYLTEKHRDIGPIVIDLDFRFEYAENDQIERKYTEDDIKMIVRTYTDLLIDYLQTDAGAGEGEGAFKVYVMEKPTPILNKGLVKDGIHIMIPEIVTRPVFQLMMREKVIPKLEDALQHLNIHNKMSDVVDEAVIERNNWQMYGSKKPHLDKYVVTRVYSCCTQTKDLKEENVSTKASDYVELLSIRNKYEETEIKFDKAEELQKYEKLIEERKMRVHFRNSVLSKTKNTRQNVNEDDFNQARCLVDLLSDERADNYNDWIRVGWCLRNIDCRLLDKWIEHSKRSRKFKDGECEKHWNYMRQDGACLGMGTLHLWAKNDNPERYNEIVQTELREYIRAARSGTEYDIAKVVEKMYTHQYIYDSRNRLWYVFFNHRWHLTDDGISLKKKLPTEVANEFRRSASYFAMRGAETENADEKERYDALVGDLSAVVKKLKKAPFQASVMTEAAMLFNVEKVDEKFDTNIHLIGFENGVYDLDALEFRNGRPEDFITLTTGINYNAFEANNAFVPEIQNFLSKVLLSEPVREYVMRLFASFLHGAIREERFHVWTGVGSNGKFCWLTKVGAKSTS